MLRCEYSPSYVLLRITFCVISAQQYFCKLELHVCTQETIA